MTLDFKDVVYSDIETEGVGDRKLYESQDIRRQAIRINNISAEKCEYEMTKTIRSKELVSGEVTRIGIYAKEYIPNHFENQKCISYALIINGVTHDIVPINSNKNGIKIIKHGTYARDDKYILEIEETIKSAKLEITMSTEDNRETPYISDLKIVTGGLT